MLGIRLATSSTRHVSDWAAGPVRRPDRLRRSHAARTASASQPIARHICGSAPQFGQAMTRSDMIAARRARVAGSSSTGVADWRKGLVNPDADSRDTDRREGDPRLHVVVAQAKHLWTPARSVDGRSTTLSRWRSHPRASSIARRNARRRSLPEGCKGTPSGRTCTGGPSWPDAAPPVGVGAWVDAWLSIKRRSPRDLARRRDLRPATTVCGCTYRRLRPRILPGRRSCTDHRGGRGEIHDHMSHETVDHDRTAPNAERRLGRVTSGRAGPPSWPRTPPS